MTTLPVRAVQRLTLAAACLAQGMMVLDVLIVSVALPAMQRELRLSPSGLEWVVSSYALVLAALIPSGGATGDHFGRKRVFVAGLALFTLASVGCALSTSGGMLIAFRVIQGIGGAVMSSLTLALISSAYPPDARSGPIGLWAAISGLAVAGGSVLGGLLLAVFSWSSIFWVNVPIGAFAIAISVVGVAESRERAPRPLDVQGLALSTLGLFLVTLGLVYSADAGWNSPVVAACIAAGAAVLAANQELGDRMRRVPAGVSRLLGVHLLRDFVLPECAALVRAAHRTVLAAVLYPVLRGSAAPAPTRPLAAGGRGGRLGMRDCGRRHSGHEPANDHH